MVKRLMKSKTREFLLSMIFFECIMARSYGYEIIAPLVKAAIE
jgi:hypothetical protein